MTWCRSPIAAARSSSRFNSWAQLAITAGSGALFHDLCLGQCLSSAERTELLTKKIASVNSVGRRCPVCGLEKIEETLARHTLVALAIGWVRGHADDVVKRLRLFAVLAARRLEDG